MEKGIKKSNVNHQLKIAKERYESIVTSKILPFCMKGA